MSIKQRTRYTRQKTERRLQIGKSETESAETRNPNANDNAHAEAPNASIGQSVKPAGKSREEKKMRSPTMTTHRAQLRDIRKFRLVKITRKEKKPNDGDRTATAIGEVANNIW